MYGGVKGSLFRGSGLGDFVGKYLLIPAQQYNVHLHTGVNLNVHILGPILHGQQQSCVEGNFFWVARHLHTVSWGWCRDYLDTILIVPVRDGSPLPLGDLLDHWGKGCGKGFS